MHGTGKRSVRSAYPFIRSAEWTDGSAKRLNRNPVPMTGKAVRMNGKQVPLNGKPVRLAFRGWGIAPQSRTDARDRGRVGAETAQVERKSGANVRTRGADARVRIPALTRAPAKARLLRYLWAWF